MRQIVFLTVMLGAFAWGQEAQATPILPCPASFSIGGDYSGGIQCSGVVLTGGDSFMSSSNLADADFANATITGLTSAFQISNFTNVNFSGAVLTGGISAWQVSNFTNTNFAGATLMGGISAFQLGNFTNVNFSGATLIGGPSSWSGAIFTDAKLASADLTNSMIGGPFDVLTFNPLSPPTYDALTLFAAGFNPVTEGWTEIQASTAVPEPATLLLLGAGFGGLAARRRMKEPDLET